MDSLNGKGKFLDHISKEYGGRIGIVLLKSLYIPESAVLIQEGILESLY